MHSSLFSLWNNMSSSTRKVKFTLEKVLIIKKDIRTKVNLRNGIDDRYAVLSVSIRDNLDVIKNTFVDKVKKKFITLMVFDEFLCVTLAENCKYSFTGFVSFGYGNTYLVVEKAYNEWGEIIRNENEDEIPF